MTRLRHEYWSGIGVNLTVATLLFASLCAAQTATTAAMALTASPYISQVGIHPNAREFLTALGNRLQTPGNESVTYQCIYTDSSGTTPATLIWQMPGYLLLTLTNRNKTYYVDAATGVQNAAGLSASELNMLESLSNDSPEAFLYAVTGQGAYRFLGQRFRTDNGKTPNYQGPWYEIFETTERVLAQNKTLRQKFYYFDSISKLLVKAEYNIPEGNSSVSVKTLYSNWTITGGYAMPGQIVRQENGTVVFTLGMSAAKVQGPQSSGTFPGH